MDSLLHLTDAFTGSGWHGAEDLVKKCKPPEERFGWLVGTNWDAGQRCIFGWARPTFKDKFFGRWLWLKMKLRLAWHNMRRGRW